MPSASRPLAPGYGIPQTTEGMLDWSWAETRLVATRGYWLATVTPAGAPHVLPVWGVWLTGPDRFACSCSPASRKARNLAADPHVVACVDSTVECVSVEGIAAPAEGDDLDLIATTYAAKYADDDQARLELDRFVRGQHVVVVRPTTAFACIDRPGEFDRMARFRWDER